MKNSWDFVLTFISQKKRNMRFCSLLTQQARSLSTGYVCIRELYISNAATLTWFAFFSFSSFFACLWLRWKFCFGSLGKYVRSAQSSFQVHYFLSWISFYLHIDLSLTSVALALSLPLTWKERCVETHTCNSDCVSSDLGPCMYAVFLYPVSVFVQHRLLLLRDGAHMYMATESESLTIYLRQKLNDCGCDWWSFSLTFSRSIYPSFHSLYLHIWMVSSSSFSVFTLLCHSLRIFTYTESSRPYWL